MLCTQARFAPASSDASHLDGCSSNGSKCSSVAEDLASTFKHTACKRANFTEAFDTTSKVCTRYCRYFSAERLQAAKLMQGD